MMPFHRPIEAFQDKSLDIEIQMLKYDHYEKLRKGIHYRNGASGLMSRDMINS
jgi:hypothetical protein